MMEEEEIKYERISYKDWRKTIPLVKIQIVARNGSRKEYYKKKYPSYNWDEDRLYFIRLIDLQKEDTQIELPYSYEDQIALLNLVLDNVVLPKTFTTDMARFKSALNELERKRNESS